MPDEETVNTFVFAVSEFLQYAPREKRVFILVHCTHGHNRTGYMIVNYLMRRNGGHVAQVQLHDGRRGGTERGWAGGGGIERDWGGGRPTH